MGNRWVAVLLVVIGCGAPGETADDAGYDSGHDTGVVMDAGHDAGFDAGHDSGFDAGFDAGHDAGQDSGPPCTCNVAGPCCDGCYFRPAGTACAFVQESTNCVGAYIRKTYDRIDCSAAGQCNVANGGAQAFFACSGTCPASPSCSQSCVMAAAEYCVVQSPTCSSPSTPDLYTTGTCP
jgi:hypothetical protein